jgi:signal transduction histidine kinase
MFGSKLLRRAFLLVSLVVLGNSLAIFFLAVPMIRNTSYRQEERAARTILDSVYDLIEEKYQSIEAHKAAGLAAHKRQLHNIVAIQESYIRSLYDEVEQGLRSERAAKSEALETLRSWRFGQDDYVWVANYDSVLISHPDPELHGSDFSQRTDIRGDLIVPPMVELARSHGAGFHSYFWRRLGEQEPVEKLTFVRHFPEWEWVIGTGVYIDDVDRIVHQRYGTAVAELHGLLRQITIASTGYMYVFDGDSNMIIHPNPSLEGRNVADLLNPVTRRPIVEELMAAADSDDPRLAYRWDRPEDPGNYAYDKISWVRHHEGFGWYVASSIYTEELMAGAISLGHRILLVSVVVLLGSVALAYVFISRLLHPIAELSAVASRVRDGDLDATVDIERDDEIGLLAGTLGEMIGQLRANIEALDTKVAERTRELEDKNRELHLSLERLEVAQAELVESEHRAVEASRAKSVFLANMSHELRTPLNAIIGYSEMIREEAEDNGWESLEEDVDRINAAARHLLAVINEILDLSGIEAGRIELEVETFDPSATVRDAVAASTAAAEANGNTLVIELGDDLGTMRSDPVRVRQILLNLLSNACKFTSDGTVSLTAARSTSEGADWLVLTIADTGIGMSPDTVDKLFEPFVQADPSTTREYGGTGLGLAISRRFSRMLGGDITVQSEPGKGSVFTVELPLVVSQEKSTEVARGATAAASDREA